MQIPVTIVLALAGAFGAPQGQVPAYFGIEPGTSSKAHVDLILGEPLRRIDRLVYDYAPPREVDDTRSVRVAYYDEGQIVARLDVRLHESLDAVPLRERFGTRVLTVARDDGGRDEYFYPQLFGLVFDDELPTAPAVGIAYLSQRYLADVYVERYNDHIRADELEEARSAADTAVLIAPDYARGYAAQAAFLETQERYDEAVPLYERAIEARYPADLQGRSAARLGSVYWQNLEQYDRAEAAFDRALALAPDLAEVQERHARFLLDRERHDEAIAAFERAEAIDPTDNDIRLGLAHTFYVVDDFESALPHYRELAAWADSEAGVDARMTLRRAMWYRLGYCLYRLNQGHDEALRAFERVIEIDPSYALGYWGAGHSLRRLDNPRSAVSYYRRGLEVEPDDYFLLQGLGNALLDAGNAEAALEAATRAHEVQPDNSLQMVNVARCWAALRKKNETRQWLRRAVRAGYADRRYLSSEEHIQALLRNDRELRDILASIR